MKSTYLSTLTPLRGIAALFVVVMHAHLFLGRIVSPTLTHFVAEGWLWVDFFFMLSGFVLSHVYSQTFAEPVSRLRFRKYISARFARVYPLHFFTLLWVAIITIVIRQATNPIDPFLLPIFSYRAIPASLLLVQSLHLFTVPPLNTPSWSLSTEWWVYLIFPALVYGLQRCSAWGKGLVLLTTAGLYVMLMYYIAPNFGLTHTVTIDLMADWGLFRCLAGFILGMLCYETYRQNWGRLVLGSSLFFVLSFGAVLVTMHRAAHDLFIIALFPFIILSAAYQTGWVKRLLDAPPLQRLGDWSFSIYMVHMPIIFTVYLVQVFAGSDISVYFNPNPVNPDYANGQLMAVLLVLLTLIISALTYRFIEVPIRNYLNDRFNTQRKEPIAVAM